MIHINLISLIELTARNPVPSYVVSAITLNCFKSRLRKQRLTSNNVYCSYNLHRYSFVINCLFNFLTRVCFQCVCFSCLNWCFHVFVFSNFFSTFNIHVSFILFIFVHYYYLSQTTVTFTNVLLACTFVACFNKLYCIVLSNQYVIYNNFRAGIRGTGSRSEMTVNRPNCQFNPLESRGNYSATSNNIKLVHWSFMGGLLHLVQREGDWAGPQPAQAPPRCSECNSPPINGQCTNHRIAV